VLEIQNWLDIFEWVNDSAGTAWYTCKTAENFVNAMIGNISTIPNDGRPAAFQRAGLEKVKDGVKCRIPKIACRCDVKPRFSKNLTRITGVHVR